MSEPTNIYAGDTWSWTREEPDYVGYTLTYYLRNETAAINIVATGSSSTFTVSVPASTTAAYKPGRYEWLARVNGALGIISVGRGTITILPNLGAVGYVDGRSHARRVLDAIEAVIEGRATHDQSSYSIGNRSLSRMSISELITFRDNYRAQVGSEEKAARIALGLGGGKIQVRF